MKNKSIKIILFLVIILDFLITTSYATGTFSISSSKTTINKGESVTLTITGNNAYGEVNISASNATVSPSSVFLQNDSKTVTITSTSTENIKVTVAPSSSGLGDIEENPITESKSLTINVNKTQTSTNTPNTNISNSNTSTTTSEKSNNANVKMIETSPIDFSGFKASKTSGYEVEVENKVDKITVNVTKEDSKATVSLLNKTNSDTGKSWVYLAEGNNEINVTVTAEDGKTSKTYTINVKRAEKVEEPEEEKPEEEQQPEEQPIEEIFGLTELKINDYELEPQFKTDIYEYKIDLKEDIEKFDIVAVSTESNSTIEITGNENFAEGENIITITVKGENEEKIATYQIIVNKINSKIENDINLEPDHQQMFSKIIIISIAAGCILLIIIIAIIIKAKKSKNINNDYIPYENILENFEDEEEMQEDEEEIINEKIKRKKHSKGKRFK